VGSVRRRGPLGSILRKQMVWAGFARGDGLGSALRWAGCGESGLGRFFQFKSFSQLNKPVGENKNRKITWGPQKNVKFCIEIDLNICHNFCIGHLDQR
jgi:hypothetical protein